MQRAVQEKYGAIASSMTEATGRGQVRQRVRARTEAGGEEVLRPGVLRRMIGHAEMASK